MRDTVKIETDVDFVKKCVARYPYLDSMYYKKGYVGNFFNRATWTHLPNNKNSKKGTRLKSEEVLEIRAKYSDKSRTVQQLADEYNREISGIYYIVQGKMWKHLLSKGDK